MTTTIQQLSTVGPAEPAPSEIFAARRRRLLDDLDGAVAIAVSSPELLKSRDTEVLYRPSSDLYYLTGVLEPEAAAIIDPNDPERPFKLFVRPSDPDREVWVGRFLGVEGAASVHGADAALPIEQLGEHLDEIIKTTDLIYYPVGVRPDVDDRLHMAIVRSRNGRQRTGKGLTGLVDLESLTAGYRLRKDDHELERLRTASRISAAGHLAAMEACRPGVGEWEIQAALEGRMRALGAEGPSFPSIVAAGANATTLHYVKNAARVADGDLVLVDAGAEWGMYAGDITRTFPACGKFTGPQRDLYDVVLSAEEAAIRVVEPGAPVAAVHDAAVEVIVRGLIDLGILVDTTVDQAIEEKSYKRFFMHQTSHWIGLDVHDVGVYATEEGPLELERGMALTVEPGVYLPVADDIPERFRGIGIRIEDDVIVTAEGREVLTRSVPVDPSEIEAIVGG